MDEIKIGSMVKPRSWNLGKRLGIGIVVQIKEYEKRPVKVLFPSRNRYMEILDFRPARIRSVNSVTPYRRRKLVNIAYSYRQMLSDLGQR